MADQCTLVAVIGESRYPCIRHEAGVHWFGAHGEHTCAAPFCRLPFGHDSLHDIPGGRPVVIDTSKGATP
jgi:hypothetical protein